MKHVTKFSNIMLIKSSKAIVLVSFLSLIWPVAAISETEVYTVDNIADGMLEAEAKFTDLRLEYVQIGGPSNEPNGPINIAKATYAQKMPKRLRYLDINVSSTNLKTQESILVADIRASYDGEVTAILDRKVESGEPMRGAVLAGYESSQFPAISMDPHTEIWYFNNKFIGNILKENRNTFRIESESEALDGASAVKLTGTIWDGVLTLKLWVSPERGFLPLKRQVMQTGGRFYSETALYDLVQLPNGMWYPKTIQSPADPPGAHNFVYTTTCNISKISIDPIPKEFFTPDFPPNTYVIDDVLKTSYTTY
jgi:hypothetical protein